MKRLVIALTVLTMMMSCGIPKDYYPAYKFEHRGEQIWFENQMVAQLIAVELSYDNGRIVREYTFKLSGPQFNHLAVDMIKFIRLHDQKAEIEIELGREGITPFYR